MAMTSSQLEKYIYLTEIQYDRVYDENTGDTDGLDQDYEDVPLGRPEPETPEEVDLVNVYLGVKAAATPLERQWQVQELRDRVKSAVLDIDFCASDLSRDVSDSERFIDEMRHDYRDVEDIADDDFYERSETLDDFESKVEAEENKRAVGDTISTIFAEDASRVFWSGSNLERAIRRRDDVWKLLDQLALKPEYAECFSDDERASAESDERRRQSVSFEVHPSFPDDDVGDDGFSSTEARARSASGEKLACDFNDDDIPF